MHFSRFCRTAALAALAVLCCLTVLARPAQAAAQAGGNISKSVLLTQSAPSDGPVSDDEVLSIHDGEEAAAKPFDVTGMLPGDAETRRFVAKVSHKGDIVLRFAAAVRSDDGLADALRVKIALPEENAVLYDGPLGQMPQSVNHPLSTDKKILSTVVYDITVSLDTSAGNEFAEKTLVADFRWWVEETENLAPPTADAMWPVLWCALAVAVAVPAVVVLRRRFAGKEAKRHG